LKCRAKPNKYSEHLKTGHSNSRPFDYQAFLCLEIEWSKTRCRLEKVIFADILFSPFQTGQNSPDSILLLTKITSIQNPDYFGFYVFEWLTGPVLKTYLHYWPFVFRKVSCDMNTGLVRVSNVHCNSLVVNSKHFLYLNTKKGENLGFFFFLVNIWIQNILLLVQHICPVFKWSIRADCFLIMHFCPIKMVQASYWFLGSHFLLNHGCPVTIRYLDWFPLFK
jgi:hypothetical protein